MTNNIQCKEVASCPLCGSTGTCAYSSLSDRLFDTEGNWNICRCDNHLCGLLWLNPAPLESELWKAYSSYYTHEANKEDSQAGRGGLIRFLQSLLAFILGVSTERKALEAFLLSKKPRGRVLEIGFGSGKRLAKLKLLGWDVEGQEVDLKSAKSAIRRGHKVHVGPLAELVLEQHAYDAIVSNHVIEHVYNPLSELKSCLYILKPGGLLIFITPNANAYGLSKFRENWQPLEPPRHLHIFTLEAAHNLLTAAGYVGVSTFSTVARADQVFAGSVDLANRGKHNMVGPVKLGLACQVAFWWIKSRIRYMRDRTTGEELVLIAYKPKEI